MTDVAFLILVAFYTYRGYHRGLVREGVDLIALVLGIWIAVKVYPVPASALHWLHVGRGWANLAGGLFIFLAFVIGGVFLSRAIHDRTGERLTVKVYRWGGAVFALGWSSVLAMFVMVLALVIPSPVFAQRSIRDSLVGSTVLEQRSAVYSLLEGHAKNEARSFLFYLRQYFAESQPKRSGSPEECLPVRESSDIEVNSRAEVEILHLVNDERRTNGLGTLRLNIAVRAVAREHSEDMYRRGFFCHTDPDGKDPFDRLKAAGIDYEYAGENLALAPTVALAHRSLMNSPRHRDNILKAEFTDLGVGVYLGPSGLMITQNFCSSCE